MTRMLCVVACQLLISAPANAAIKVTTVTPLVADICDACEAPQVRLPIAVEGVPAGAKLNVAIRDVSLSNKHDSVYLTGLTASAVVLGSGFELQLTVVPNTLREDGTYVVALEFSIPGQPPVSTTMQLVRAAAALQPPGTIIVERVLATPWSDSSGVGPPLRLQETSQRTGLADVRVLSPNPLGPERIEITLKPEGCPTQSTTDGSNANGLQLPPAQARCLQDAATGDFPWGSQLQTYSLVASELTAPVPINFDVRTRLWRIYVVIYILLGSLVGFLVKIKLQKTIDRAQAVALSLELEEKVSTDLKEHPDAQFQSALKVPLDQLIRARTAGAVEGMVAARTALDSVWRNALTELATRRAAAEQLLDRLRTVVETQWQLPVALVQVIDALRLGVEQSRGLLAKDAVSDATATATTSLGGARNSFRSALVAWQDKVVDLFDSVAASPEGFSPTLVAAVTTSVSEAKMRIGSAQLSPTATADELIAALTAASSERRAATKVARVIGLALDQEVDRVTSILGRTREAAGKVTAAVELVKQSLFEAIDRPDRGPDATRTALAALSKAWRETFEAIGGKALPKAVTDFLDQQRFAEAATSLIASLRGESDESVAARRRDTMPAVAADDPGVSIQMFSTRSSPTLAVAPIQALRARTQGQIAAAKLFQSVVVLLLACIIGYGLFAPKFIGDYQDFMIIFFWAFALDMSVDAVTRLAPTARR